MGIITVILSLIYGFSIGANDAANSFGTWIGTRIGKIKTGMILCGSFALAGALLEGYKVSKTIGSGIIPQEYITIEIAIIGLVSSILWVMAASLLGLPISTTHSIVGAVAGLGFAILAPVKLDALRNIVICWVTTPTGSFIIAFLIFSLLNFILKITNFEEQFIKIGRIFLTLTSCYVAYTWGANDVANATALISASNILTPRMACFIGGAGMLLGTVILGYKVAITVGFNVTRLDTIMGICANLATAITIHIFTELHMPVSTSHAIVGAVFGVGLVKGKNLVNLKIVREIVFTWMVTPIFTGVLSIIIFHMVKIFIK